MRAEAQVPGWQGPEEPESKEQRPVEIEPGEQRRRAPRTGAIRAQASQARRAEHAADTREALIAAARRRFAADGFDGTGTEQIVAEARVTRGALYHHFRDKADLFRAVMAQAAADVAQQLIDEQLAAEAPSPLDEIREGVSAFLDVCIGGDFQRIVLVDGPRVLGTDAWEELVDRYGRGILEEWLSRAAATGDLDAVPVRALARLLIAMLTEAGLAIARADHPAAERAELGEVLDRMLTGLRPPQS
jgi:AcrR family transcriptional regulator